MLPTGQLADGQLVGGSARARPSRPAQGIRLSLPSRRVMAPVPAIAGPARTRAEGAGPRCPTAKGGAGRAARALAGGRIAEGDTAGQGRRRSLQGRLAPAPSEPPPPLALINPTQAYATCPRPHSHFTRPVHQRMARRASRAHRRSVPPRLERGRASRPGRAGPAEAWSDVGERRGGWGLGWVGWVDGGWRRGWGR